MNDILYLNFLFKINFMHLFSIYTKWNFKHIWQWWNNFFYCFYRNLHRQNEWLWCWFPDGGRGSSRLCLVFACVTSDEQKRDGKGKRYPLGNRERLQGSEKQEFQFWKKLVRGGFSVMGTYSWHLFCSVTLLWTNMMYSCLPHMWPSSRDYY